MEENYPFREEIIEKNKADLYLYSTKDAEYIQDGTRLEIDERNKLDESHRNLLKQNNINFLEISGSWKNENKKQLKILKNLLQKRKNFRINTLEIFAE